ncbi:Amino acid permease 6 [Senna tora]|uniref:Amino acid permease 6 n=1 Tax=Senna tora TaxID=362788 RepID=A0A834SW16_9FABA|nr:Amino acid permease 6 [Senna tora]
MAMESQMNINVCVEAENGGLHSKFDEDGRPKRTGTWMTGSAHIVTAVIGSGVLSLAWAMAQLGWIAGPIVLLIFSLITLFTSCLLTDCYRSPHPVHGTRNYTYMQIVKTNLGGVKYLVCGFAQYGNLIGISIGYIITASVSMVAIKRSQCFHKYGHDVGCHTSNNPFMIIFGIVEIVLSQIPNFHELSFLSILAAIMSFGYATIGIGLSIAKIAGGGNHVRTSLTGTTIGVDVTSSGKLWNTFQALGNIAFAYAFSTVIVEIQASKLMNSHDTLKSSPPENQAMKKAAFTGILITTTFYMSCGILGYAAFGNTAPGNFLTGFGFYEPFWLIDIESWSSKRWAKSDFVTKEHYISIPVFGIFRVNKFRVIWRILYVIVTTVIAMMLPFFNSILGLLGAASFWPLTVYFPVEMYISQAQMKRFSPSWVGLKLLSGLCLLVTLVAAAGSIQGIIAELKAYKPFQSVS